MSGFTTWLIDPSGLTPHGFCLLWEPGLIWTYAASDTGIGIAYLLISTALGYFSRQRRDLVFKPLVWMFAAFILLCGASHLLDVLTLWVPAYGIEAIIKTATAAISLLTAAALWRVMPRALALPTPSQLREAHHELEASHLRYRTSFKLSPIPLYMLDGSNAVVGVSNSWLALLGYDRAEVIGKQADDFQLSGPGSDAAIDRLTLQAEGQVLDRARRFRHRDGSIVEALVSARLENQEPDAMAVCLLIDVTARRRTEAALEASRRDAAEQERREQNLRRENEVLSERLHTQQAEDRLRYATQAGRLGTWELDLQTMELTTSAMCKGCFGVEPNDMFGYHQFLASLDAADRARFEAALEQSVSGSEDLDGDFRLQQGSGVVGWVQMHGRVINPPDGGRRLAGISLNITERVRTEERIRHSQRVEAVGRLTAGVAHDFNNVLQTLLGGIELAIDALFGQPDIQSDLELALQAGRRGAKLTSHLLSFSRQQKLSPVALDLGQMLDDLARTLVRTLGADITVSVRHQPGLPPILADAAYLDSALLNLALNARDAMPAGGTLLIEAQALDGEVAVSVSDTGEGMPPEVLARACDPFFSTKGAKGSGLGLSMVQGFAQQSGGDMRIESSPGHGTRIELRLPRTTAPGRPTAARQIGPIGGSGRILLVDDQPDVSRVTALFLRRAGYQVTTAFSADEALKELDASEPFDALVTDFAMPGTNGAELVRQARLAFPSLPTLLTSGYAAVRGADGIPDDVEVLLKPFGRHELLEKVKMLLEKVGQPSGAAEHVG